LLSDGVPIREQEEIGIGCHSIIALDAAETIDMPQ